MKAIPAMILYYQTYHTKGQEEVAYCPICEDVELLVDCVDDEVNFAFCPDCHGTFYRDNLLWKEATKDSENNPPPDSEKYHAVFVLQQGQGNWTNVKYRTYLDGTIDEYDKLQRLIRKLKPLKASTLIDAIELYDSSVSKVVGEEE